LELIGWSPSGLCARHGRATLHLDLSGNLLTDSFLPALGAALGTSGVLQLDLAANNLEGAAGSLGELLRAAAAAAAATPPPPPPPDAHSRVEGAEGAAPAASPLALQQLSGGRPLISTPRLERLNLRDNLIGESHASHPAARVSDRVTLGIGLGTGIGSGSGLGCLP